MFLPFLATTFVYKWNVFNLRKRKGTTKQVNIPAEGLHV